MASTTMYSRIVKRLAATAALGLLTATSQAGLFCDWKVDHKRPYCSPACEPDWGYNETCWRQFPPTKPCTDWGAHCSTCPTGDTYQMQGGYGPNMGAMQTMDDLQQPAAGMMIQQPQGAIIMQQPMMQNQPSYSVPMNNMVPQNSYNSNPAMVPPVENQPQYGQPQQQPPVRTYGADPQNSQPSGAPSGDVQPQGGDSLQLPGLDSEPNGLGTEGMQLPKLPDLSQARPYYNPGYNVQANQNSYQAVSQSNIQNAYGNQPTSVYPSSINPANQMMPSQMNGQSYYGQPAVQQNYAQPLMQQQQQFQQQQQMPAYPQANNQIQAPQPNRYQPQPAVIQVAPGRQPSVRGVSFTQSIRPASNRPNVSGPVPAPKRSFLSKINPFSSK